MSKPLQSPTTSHVSLSSQKETEAESKHKSRAEQSSSPTLTEVNIKTKQPVSHGLTWAFCYRAKLKVRKFTRK